MYRDRPLCKYCNKEMQIDSIDYADVFYKCDCEGYKIEQDLNKEIGKLKNNLYDKEIELKKHVSNSYFNRELTSKEKEIQDLKDDYHQYSNTKY